MDKSREILEAVNKVPLLSQAASRLMTLIGDPDHSIAQIAEVVQADPALTANLLKAVNSASLGLRQPVSTVDRAVAYLGDKTTAWISLSMSAGDLYTDALDGYESERNALWDHSLRTALAARELADYAKTPVNPDVAYTAGLLHDIGKSVISEFLKGTAPEILAELDIRSERDYMDVVREKIGTDHCEVGAALAERWNLPETLKMPIRYHHHPSKVEDEYKALVFVIHLADMLAMMSGAGSGADAFQYKFDNSWVDHVNITSKQLEKLVLRVMDEFEKAKDMLNQ